MEREPERLIPLKFPFDSETKFANFVAHDIVKLQDMDRERWDKANEVLKKRAEDFESALTRPTIGRLALKGLAVLGVGMLLMFVYHGLLQGLGALLCTWFFWAEGKAWGHREGFIAGWEEARDATVLEMLGISPEDGKYLSEKVWADKTRR